MSGKANKSEGNYQVGVPETNARRHIPELDALRGAAACVVLLNHFHQFWLETSHPAWLEHPKMNPLLWLCVDGHSSVILFFLLSGFVLTLPYLRGKEHAYSTFALRRICRIYLPYLAALLLSMLACSFFFGEHLYGPDFQASWRVPPDALSAMQHLLMIGRFDIFRYDAPVWSLVHEMRISLVFPLIYYCALRLRGWVTVTLAIACTVSASLLQATLESNLPGQVRMVSWSLTLSYCGIFLLGSALARRHESFSLYLDRLGPVAKLMLFGVASLFYLYPPPTPRILNLTDMFIACGGLVIITFCLRLHGVLSALLRRQSMQFLGRISYSLYLLHLPILLVLSVVTYHRIVFGFLLVPFVAISVSAAAMLYRLVEVPSINLGRRLERVILAMHGVAA